MTGIPDLKSFFEGIAISQVGGIPIGSPFRNDILRMDFDENYTGRIIMSNGDTYTITDVTLNSDNKITNIVMSHNDDYRSIPMAYDSNGYLIKVGTVEVADIDKLNLPDYEDVNNKKF